MLNARKEAREVTKKKTWFALGCKSEKGERTFFLKIAGQSEGKKKEDL